MVDKEDLCIRNGGKEKRETMLQMEGWSENCFECCSRPIHAGGLKVCMGTSELRGIWYTKGDVLSLD